MRRLVRLLGLGLAGALLAVTAVHAGEVVDTLGRRVTLPDAPRTLVALGPGALRLVTYLGLEGRLVGVEAIEQRTPAARPYRVALDTALDGQPIVGPGGPGRMPDFERLLALRPDVVVTAFMDAGQLRLLEERTGIPVLALSYGPGYGGPGQRSKIQGVKDSLRLLGDVFGRSGRAEALVAGMRDMEAELAAILGPGQVPRVYVGGLGYKGAHGVASTEGGFLPFALLGLSNALLDPGVVGHRTVQLESLLAAELDWLFVDRGGRALVEEDLARHPGLFARMPALADGRAYWLKVNNFYNTNIANTFVNAYAIAALLRPGLGIDPAARARAVYRLFFGEDAAARVMERHYVGPPAPVEFHAAGR